MKAFARLSNERSSSSCVRGGYPESRIKKSKTKKWNSGNNKPKMYLKIIYLKKKFFIGHIRKRKAQEIIIIVQLMLHS